MSRDKYSHATTNICSVKQHLDRTYPVTAKRKHEASERRIHPEDQEDENYVIPSTESVRSIGSKFLKSFTASVAFRKIISLLLSSKAASQELSSQKATFGQ